ncbi:MAG: sugar ABC transporter ATP-binding protein [Rubellimicrobium sp.]|nr:sugar ABC transporter ATP-binding protein [Rubellimicrobium sp.]
MTLELRAISRSYGPVQALRGVSLHLHPGEVHALMGENGAGKSTLIRVLAGLEQPDEGGITLDGRGLTLSRPEQAQALGLRFIHQEMQVVPGLSVAENMHLHLPFPRRAGLIDWRALRARARAALGALGLDHIDPAVPMLRLALGDRMLCRIAATLIGDQTPRFYVMDEPTAALTGAESGRLFAVIRDLRARGAGILYVSHRMAEVMALADRITVLRDGAHVSTRARAATDEAALIHDMTGRDLSDLFPPRAAAPPGEPVLRVRGLVAGPLRGIDLDLAPGEILGVAGLAGAGRGELLRAIMGAIPRAGSVTIGGRALPAGSPAAAWRAGLAHIPRERRAEGLMMLRPIVENASLPHLAHLARGGLFLNRPAERRLLAERGAEVRLKAAGPQVPPVTLSGGNQQKVLFARAVGGAPRVLLLDEPTRGVDVGARHDLYRVIRALAGRGVAVILASSDLPEVIGLADRVAVLQGGQIAHCLPNDDLTEGALLALCYPGAAA